MIAVEATRFELGVIRAVERSNLLAIVRAQAERVAYFARRIAERGLSPSEWVIVVLEVDDPNGRQFADLLMPGHDWEAVRQRDGGPPFARGLANREAMQMVLADDTDCARELAELTGIGVLAVGRGIAAVYAISEVTP